MRICRECRERPARSNYPSRHGPRVRFRKNHDLCFRCWRSLMDASRAPYIQTSTEEQEKPSEHNEWSRLDERGIALSV